MTEDEHSPAFPTIHGSGGSRRLRMGVFLVAGTLITAMIVMVSYGLWFLAASDKQLRFQAIQTAITLLLSLGTLVSLVFVARQHRLQERSQLHQEQVATRDFEHQQRIARATVDDATERRITDLYVKAVDQLGSGSAPVRLGGLHALARLAQSNPDHRQTIADVICAYLRMPWDATDSMETPTDVRIDGRATPPSVPTSVTDREELEVRLTAQRILSQHLRPADGPSGSVANITVLTTFWPQVNIVNLAGARLINLDLEAVAIHTLDLRHAVLIGPASLRGLSCHTARFDHCRFTASVDYRSAQIGGEATFDHAVFAETARFGDRGPGGREPMAAAVFRGPVSFRGTTFMKQAFYDDVLFADSADFSDLDDESIDKILLDYAQFVRIDQNLRLPTGWKIHDGRVRRR